MCVITIAIVFKYFNSLSVTLRIEDLACTGDGSK